MFAGLPYLSHPVVKDADEGMYVIRMLLKEMERRIKLDRDVRMEQPEIICVIDEYISFIKKINSKEIESAISEILQHGRHSKIHMVLAAQNPTGKNMLVDISNVTARMAFRCAKYQNSIAILGESGAEKLPGKGAMLYCAKGYPDPIYTRGIYATQRGEADGGVCEVTRS